MISSKDDVVIGLPGGDVEALAKRLEVWMVKQTSSVALKPKGEKNAQDIEQSWFRGDR